MRKWVLIQFAAVTAVAEALQLVALLWSTLSLSGSPVMVGVVNAFAFIPGVVAGVTLKRAFDRGNPLNSLGRTNWVNVICSIGLAIAVLLSLAPGFLVVGFCLSQAVMSVAKLANKSAMARSLRLLVGRDELATVQGRMSSVTIVGGLVGSGLGGVGLALLGPGWCFVVASLLYVASVLLVNTARRYVPQTSVVQTAGVVQMAVTGGAPLAQEAQEALPSGSSRLKVSDGLPVLALVLIVSIPSSGALQFVTALLPSYADALVPKTAPFYSVLDIAAMVGGVLAGLVVGISPAMRRFIYRYALGISGVLCLVTAIVSWPIVAVGLVAIVSLSITVHVVSMQVATNQMAPEGSVGRYMALRNAGVGIAKTVFSLAAGWLAQFADAEFAWFALGAFLVLASAAFWCSGSWRKMAKMEQ
ncbi:MFS transporter [Psychromicrobium sp. YIM B11713]|uniref:MFS transporter n=1 Tax=Psychromicrobium sp. YIM B11713 TaxID=3145233 RepID=UPI00374F0664